MDYKADYLKDKDFLRELDNQVNKFYQVKIEVLDAEEHPIRNIEGRVLPGSSINIDGNSSMRRTCSINLIAEEAENDLTNIENLLSINKKIRIFEGFKNEINPIYPDIVWFPLGIFVIVQPNVNHTISGCNISLSCKDKMCLLNGECGGNLPTSVTFHAYDQIIGEQDCGTVDPETKGIINPEDPIDPDEEDMDNAWKLLSPNNQTVYKYKDEKTDEIIYKTWSEEDGQTTVENNSLVGKRVVVKQLFYDIIQTLVCNFGGESLDNIFINDVPVEIKQLVRQVGSNPLYYGENADNYQNYSIEPPATTGVRKFKFNEDVGYVYTSFTYADMGGGNGELISNIGDNVCTILDKIKTTLGNFEYFYDVDGHFIFQEVKNYLNNSYNAEEEASTRLSTCSNDEASLTEQGLCIMDNINYQVNFTANTKSVYTFEEGKGLITSFSNSPNYNNLRNDFHIQGKDKENYAIHYHLVIKDKPIPEDYGIHPVTKKKSPLYRERKVVFLQKDGKDTGALRLAREDEEGVSYIPSDWRAELYLQGLEAQAVQQRPDVYQQELLDLFDSIYDFKKQQFKTDLVTNPNVLKYFIDYLEPSNELFDYSVNAIGQKLYSYQQDNIRKLYNTDVPDTILVDSTASKEKNLRIRSRCAHEGQVYTNVIHEIYANTAIGTIGYTAQEVARDLLYQYTNYAESITIQAIPIYYLEPNTMISVYDKKSGIHGDYIIKSISLPLDAGGQMSISAIKANMRI